MADALPVSLRSGVFVAFHNSLRFKQMKSVAKNKSRNNFIEDCDSQTKRHTRMRMERYRYKKKLIFNALKIMHHDKDGFIYH